MTPASRWHRTYRPSLWPPTLPDVLDRKLERASAYAKAARSAATRKAYASDGVIFTAWCEGIQMTPLPASPVQVAIFAADQADAGLNPSTIVRRVAAIGHYHRAAGFPAPAAQPDAGGLAEVMAGIRAEKACARSRSARPTLPQCVTCLSRSEAMACVPFATVRCWQSAWPRHSDIPSWLGSSCRCQTARIARRSTGSGRQGSRATQERFLVS